MSQVCCVCGNNPCNCPKGLDETPPIVDARCYNEPQWGPWTWDKTRDTLSVDNGKICYHCNELILDFKIHHPKKCLCDNCTQKKTEKKDIAWLRIADKQAKELSKCQKRQVCAIIVDKNGIQISSGYNGHPRGSNKDDVCLRKDKQSGVYDGRSYCTHAEINSLIFADFDRLEGATIYLTHSPCQGCVPYLLQARLSNLVYYNDEIERNNGIDLIKELSEGSMYPINIRSYDRET